MKSDEPVPVPANAVKTFAGFNLLPYRQRATRRARRRALAAMLAGGLAGCALLGVMAAWVWVERARLDARHERIEHTLAALAAPLAEHARLAQADAEWRTRVRHAAVLSEPLTRLLGLMQSLSDMSGQGVLVRQVRFNERDAEVLATAAGHAAFATWTDQLGKLDGAKGVDVSDVRRETEAGRGPVALAGREPLAFAARVRWLDAPTRARPSTAHRPSGGDAARLQIDRRGPK